jgi:predicted DCC family thiol-disulfide oxidoreductase YuxK
MPFAAFSDSSSVKALPSAAPGMQGLSLFRILFGLLLLYDFLVCQAPFFTEFFTDQGFYPRAANAGRWWADYLSVLQWVDAPWYQAAFITVYIISLLFFIAGYQTRIVKWVVFICYISLYFRNPIILYGYNNLAKLLLFWCLFLPLNRYWSVDAALSRAPRDAPVPGIFLRAIEMQIGMVYLFAALWKLMGGSWVTGLAVKEVLHDGIHSTALGMAFADALPFLMVPLNYTIILFQAAFALFLFSLTRNGTIRLLALLGAGVMHVSFMLFLEVGLFPYLGVICLVLLLPDPWISKALATRRMRLEKITLYFEPGCVFCEKTARLFREMCLSPFAQVLPASDENGKLALLRQQQSWIVDDAQTGKSYLKWQAVAFVLRQNPLTWVLGVTTDWPVLRGVMAALYDFIGKSRPAFGKITAWFFPYTDTHSTPPRMVQAVCACLIVLAVCANLFGFYRFITRSSTPVSEEDAVQIIPGIFHMTQVSQNWNLFAPSPARFHYRYQVDGETVSGEVLDISPFFERSIIWRREPGRVQFENHYWIKYYGRLRDHRYGLAFQWTLRRLCESYNQAHPDAKIKAVFLGFYQADYSTPSQYESVLSDLNHRVDCSALAAGNVTLF